MTVQATARICNGILPRNPGRRGDSDSSSVAASSSATISIPQRKQIPPFLKLRWFLTTHNQQAKLDAWTGSK